MYNRFVFQEALKGGNRSIQLQMTSPTNPYALLLVCFDHAAEAEAKAKEQEDANANAKANANANANANATGVAGEGEGEEEDEMMSAFDIARINDWISFHVPRGFAFQMRALRSRLNNALEGKLTSLSVCLSVCLFGWLLVFSSLIWFYEVRGRVSIC